MFGVNEEQLIDGLEAIRRRLCGYGASLEESCDCKFGIGSTEDRPSTEQTGCPELRQAIKLLQGKYTEIVLVTQLTEQSAARTGGTGPTQDTILERFRDWLGEHVWAKDDMGGFLQPSANPEFERQAMANVGALFDLLDPDWRSYTWSGRRGASGRRGE